MTELIENEQLRILRAKRDEARREWIAAERSLNDYYSALDEIETRARNADVNSVSKKEQLKALYVEQDENERAIDEAGQLWDEAVRVMLRAKAAREIENAYRAWEEIKRKIEAIKEGQ